MLAERDQQMLGARPQNAPGRGRGDRPAQHLLAGGRPPRPELELAAETLDRRDHIVDRAGVDARTGEQRLNVAVTSGREQQMLGLDPGVTEHARLVIGQQDRVVGLVGKPAQRILRPADRDAGICRQCRRWYRPRPPAPVVLGCISRRSAPCATGSRALTAGCGSCQPLLWPDPTHRAMLGDDTPETMSLAPSWPARAWAEHRLRGCAWAAAQGEHTSARTHLSSPLTGLGQSPRTAQALAYTSRISAFSCVTPGNGGSG